MGKDAYLVNLSDKRILENAGDRIPIGLYSIAANNKNVKVYDLNHDSEKRLMIDVIKNQPDSVGISVYTSAVVPEAISLANRLSGFTHTIAGGYHATAEPESLLPYFNTVVRGEGEKLLGLAKKVDGIVVGNPPNLSELENPSFPQNMSKYQMQQSGKRTATIISSRGCPYSCGFCGKLSDKMRFEPVEKVKDQIDTLKNRGFEAFYFVDDVFTLKKDRMKQIVEHINAPYRITTRANLIDESKLEILSQTGCDWISLGIESCDDNILNQSNKQITTQQNINAVKLATKYNINTKGFFILGLPGETEKSAKRTILGAKGFKELWGLKEADVYFLSPFPGTPIWKNPEKFGINIRDKDYTKYLQAGKTAKCYVDTKELKAERIEELVEEFKQVWKS